MDDIDDMVEIFNVDDLGEELLLYRQDLANDTTEQELLIPDSFVNDSDLNPMQDITDQLANERHQEKPVYTAPENSEASEQDVDEGLAQTIGLGLMTGKQLDEVESEDEESHKPALETDASSPPKVNQMNRSVV